MKRDEQHVGKTVDRFLESLSDPPSPAEMEAAGERVLQRLRSAVNHASEESSLPSSSVGWMFRWRLAAAALILIVLASGAVIYRLAWNDELHAVVETAGDGLKRLSGATLETLKAGQRIERGEVIRSSGGAGAVLAVSDGTRMEMRSNSEISLERAADGIRIRLSKGSIIVAAAKQRSGHLYVEAKDCTVSVVGTVFLVETSDAGSRVTVIEGVVEVRQGGTLKRLVPGERTTTAPLMEPPPLTEELQWTRYWSAYLKALQQAGVLQSARPRFETASITLERATPDLDPRNEFLACHGVEGNDQPSFGGAAVIAPQGSCVGRHVPLASLIAYAHGISPAQVVNSPAQRFRIEARAEEASTATLRELRQMLQTTLADKFKLRFHSETRQSPGYVLFLATGGSKLRETSDEQEPVAAREGNRVTIRGRSSIRKLADFLSKRILPDAGAPILDKTELTGIYDYVLRLDRRDSIRSALEQQLGVRMQSVQLPVEVLVVDEVYAEETRH